jgi:hypothetical protein
LLPLLRGLTGPAISSLVAGAVCLLTLNAYPPGTALTLLSLIAAIVAFLISMLIFDRKSLIEDWDAIRRLAGRSNDGPRETTADSLPRP